MRELPRKLSVEELAELFEGRSGLVDRLAEVEDPLGQADDVLAAMSEEEKLEALDAHPAIGARRLSARSAAEQGSGLASRGRQPHALLRAVIRRPRRAGWEHCRALAAVSAT